VNNVSENAAEAVAVAVRAHWPTTTHIFEHYAECSYRYAGEGESFALTWPCPPSSGSGATPWLPYTADQITETITNGRTQTT
jgi:hypothetical protein